MGKIYDALKKAEKEAKINRANHQSLDNKKIINSREPSEAKKEFNHMSLDTRKGKSGDAQEMMEMTKTPSLKLIPEVITPIKKEARRFPLLNLLKRKEKNSGDRNLFVMHDPNSFAAEQYRILRTRILGFGKEINMRTILITSCLPEEGKSTVASNLSICIANGINEHVLLIDCDLRRPVIHKIFGLNGNAGLSNYLNEDVTLSHTLTKTEVEKLTIIPAGTSPDNPSELLSSNKMMDLVHEVKSRYDDRYIIFDSTPVYQTPDPAILAKHIDGIVLVVKSGKANREVIARTVESLGKEKILGVVFNMSHEPVKSYYYNYNHYYSTQ